MKNENLVLWLVLLIYMCSSCEEDVEIGIDGEESLIAYCVLNQKDSLNFIRIEKTTVT